MQNCTFLIHSIPGVININARQGVKKYLFIKSGIFAELPALINLFEKQCYNIFFVIFELIHIFAHVQPLIEKGKMIKKFTLLILVLYTFSAWGQQDGFQTYFQFNEMSYNPSYAGKVKDKMCVSMLIHQQYVGFKSDLILDKDGRAAVDPYSVQASTQYLNLSAHLFGKLGVAVNIINDKIGPQQFILPKLSL